MFSTREAARKYELYAARGLADHARETKADLQRAVWDMAIALEAMKDCGASTEWVEMVALGLRVEARAIDAKCLRLIDEAEETAEQVDLSEIQIW